MDRKQRMCEMDELFQQEFKKRMNNSTAEMQKRFEDLAKKGIPRAYMYEFDNYLKHWNGMAVELQNGSERKISTWLSDCRFFYNQFMKLVNEVEETKKKKGGDSK